MWARREQQGCGGTTKQLWTITSCLSQKKTQTNTHKNQKGDIRILSFPPILVEFYRTTALPMLQGSPVKFNYFGNQRLDQFLYVQAQSWLLLASTQYHSFLKLSWNYFHFPRQPLDLKQMKALTLGPHLRWERFYSPAFILVWYPSCNSLSKILTKNK